jgi:pimeloyl-ACP methyl ester carboxylesterase
MSGLVTQAQVMSALRELVPGVTPGELSRDGRVLRWVEAGTGQPAVVLDAALGEPGTLAWAGVVPEVARSTRAIAYDRAGLGTSDPVSPPTLETEVADLAAIAARARAQAGGSCVLVGHSWGGLLALLVALQHPGLIAGLILVDPADETYWESLPAQVHLDNQQSWTILEEQQAKGEHAPMITGVFGDFARQLASSPQVQALVQDAYVASYGSRSQVEMVRLENQLLTSSTPAISAIRRTTALPDIPLVVFSATQTVTGTPPEDRERWTRLNGELAASVPRGRHVVLADTSHAVNQEQPHAIAESIIAMIDQLRTG